MTTETMPAALEKAHEGLERVKQQLGGEVEASRVDESSSVQGNGLDVVTNSRPDDIGIRPIDIRVSELASTPQLLGRALVWLDPTHNVYRPATLNRDRRNPRIIRLSILPVEFDFQAGMTDGLLLGLGLETETQSPLFGSHNGTSGASAFEQGHFASIIGAGKSEGYAAELARDGDQKSDLTIARGVPGELNKVGAVSSDIPLAVNVDLDTAASGQAVQLGWHESFVGEDGAALLALYKGGAQLLLGRAFYDMNDTEIDRASSHIEDAVKGAR